MMTRGWMSRSGEATSGGAPVRARRLLPVLGLVSLLAVTGCVPDDQRTDSVDPEQVRNALTPELRAQIDSGNAAFRDGEMERALEYFRTVTDMAPDNPTGWFGLYMAHDALGNTDEANAAIEQARSLAPGASLIHDTLRGGR